MSGIPDWAWKALQLFIVPVALWAIATHINLKNQELRLSTMEKQFVSTEKELDNHQSAISETRQDIEILKVRMEYVVKGIDDIKDMLEEDRKNRK